MYRDMLLIAFGCLAASAFLTGVARRYLASRKLLAIPNARSSHEVPTPQGGGIAIVAATTAALCVLAAVGIVSLDVAIAFVGGGLGVAWVGFLDDRGGVSPKVRIVVHFAAAAWALAWLGGLPPIPFGDRLLDPGVGGYVLGALGIVWSLNLFNFMDGIDGIAASEASFMAFAGAFLAIAMGASASVPALALALGCACLGFLAWNWPPAKIFMGDIGSGYIGYSLALVAILAARDHPVAWLVWLTLGAVFFVDATLTLARRVLRGERVYQAHRSHAYQWLARRFGHRPVTVGVIAVNVVWLLPCAWLASVHPSYAAWIALGALLPIVVAAVAAGVGRREIGASPQ